MSKNLIQEVTEKKPSLNALLFEDQIDLSGVPVSKTDAECEIGDCNNYLRLGNAPMAVLIDNISFQSMETIYFAAASYKENSTALHYITGLKMYFGVNEAVSDEAISLIYQPVFLERTNLTGNVGEYTAKFEGPLFVHEGDKGFQLISAANAQVRTDAYDSLLRIKRIATQTDYDLDEKGTDVVAVTFPFQTIFALLSGNNYAGIQLYNSIRKEKGASMEDIVKHCVLLLGDDPKTENPNPNIFTNMFANRSHLCPPSCKKVEEPLLPLS